MPRQTLDQGGRAMGMVQIGAFITRTFGCSRGYGTDGSLYHKNLWLFPWVWYRWEPLSQEPLVVPVGMVQMGAFITRTFGCSRGYGADGSLYHKNLWLFPWVWCRWEPLSQEPLVIPVGMVQMGAFITRNFGCSRGYGADWSLYHKNLWLFPWVWYRWEPLSQEPLVVPLGMVQIGAFITRTFGCSLGYGADWSLYHKNLWLFPWVWYRWEPLSQEPLVVPVGMVQMGAFITRNFGCSLGYGADGSLYHKNLWLFPWVWCRLEPLSQEPLVVPVGMVQMGAFITRTFDCSCIAATHFMQCYRQTGRQADIRQAQEQADPDWQCPMKTSTCISCSDVIN